MTKPDIIGMKRTRPATRLIESLAQPGDGLAAFRQGAFIMTKARLARSGRSR